MAATGHSQQSGPPSPSPHHVSAALESTAASSTEEGDEEEEEESIAATRPRREHKAPQSIYTAPTQLRRAKQSSLEAELTKQHNRRRRARRKRARDSRDSRELPRPKAAGSGGGNELLAEAEPDDEDEADDGGRGGFMSAPRSKRRKSLYGARRKHRPSDGSLYGDDGADSDRGSADTQSEDERRQQEEDEEVEDRRRRRRAATANEPPIIIHLRVRITAGRDNGGKFCAVRKYQIDHFTGVIIPPAPRRQQQQHSPMYRNGHSQHSDDEADDGQQHSQYEPTDDSDKDTTHSNNTTNQSSSIQPRRPRRSVYWPPKPSTWEINLNLPVLHTTALGRKVYGVLPNAMLVVSSKGKLAMPAPGTFDYSVFGMGREQSRTKDEHDDVVVKKEEVEEASDDAERATIRQIRSASVGSAGSTAPATTGRSPYAQHSLTSTAADENSTAYPSYYSSSPPISSSRYSFDSVEAAGPYVPPPPPATFPPSPPASPPAPPRVMRTLHSMPSLEYDIANVRAGIHPLYLSALEQIDRLRSERQQAVMRLQRERLQHVNDLYEAEMKQVEEEWKDEARGLQARIIDQLTTQHRHSAHSPNSSSAAVPRTLRRRHHLMPVSGSRAVLKRYHAEYCLPAVERRADVDRCRRLIEAVMGDDEGGDILRRIDERMEKRRERSGAWRRHTRDLDGLSGWNGSGRHDDSARGLVARSYAATRRQRDANGRFQ